MGDRLRAGIPCYLLTYLLLENGREVREERADGRERKGIPPKTR